jgi:putative flavoprotein involved in K+ transport
MSFVGSRVLTMDTPIGRNLRRKVRAGGGPLVRVKSAHLRTAGVERVLARTVGVRDGQPLLERPSPSGHERHLVRWLRHSHRWIEVPIEGKDGWPQETRGVVASASGLYFIGLPFLYSVNSSLVVGVAPDAAYLADQIASRATVGQSS